MKKILTVGAAIALALGFASCNKNESNIPDTPTNEGTTYMSLTFRLPAESGTRAEDQTNNGIGQWEGRDTFKNVDVYLVTDGAKSVEKRTLEEVTKATSTADGVYKTESWKTTPGEKTVYVVVNNGGAVKEALDAATVTNFAEVYKKAYEMLEKGKVKAEYANATATEDVIMMTGQPVTQTIKDGVTKPQADDAAKTAGKNVANNKVQVTVRRVVSRVSVSATKGLISSEGAAEIKTTEDKVIGQLKDLSWTPMQLEQTSYLLWQDVADGVEYTAKATKSPNYNYVPVSSSYGTEAPKFYSYDRKNDKLIIRPDFVRNIIDNQKNIAWITGDKNNMEFITENTHEDYRRGNTTYVKVTGTFVPDAGTWAEGERAKYEEKLATNPTPSIYWGATTGKFYFDKDTALEKNPVSEEAKKNGKDGVIEFKAGKMYYFAWINPNETNHLKWTTSPVVRNNIYHINIAAFKNVGLYRNPYDPGEDPKDPDDPDPKDPEDPLNDKETYMVTEVTVINWGMHSYDVEF